MISVRIILYILSNNVFKIIANVTTLEGSYVIVFHISILFLVNYINSVTKGFVFKCKTGQKLQTIISSNHGRISVSNFVCGSDEFAFLIFFVLQISSCHRTFCAGPNLSNTISQRSFVTLPSENPLRSVSTVFQNYGTFQVCLMLYVTKDIVS